MNDHICVWESRAPGGECCRDAARRGDFLPYSETSEYLRGCSSAAWSWGRRWLHTTFIPLLWARFSLSQFRVALRLQEIASGYNDPQGAGSPAGAATKEVEINRIYTAKISLVLGQSPGGQVNQLYAPCKLPKPHEGAGSGLRFDPLNVLCFSVF